MLSVITASSNLEEITAPGCHASHRTLCLVFGGDGGEVPLDSLHFLQDLYPDGVVIGMSGAGIFTASRVSDTKSVVVVMHFEHSNLHCATVAVPDNGIVPSGDALQASAESVLDHLAHPKAGHIFLFTQRAAAYPALLDAIANGAQGVTVWGGDSGAFNNNDRWLWVNGRFISNGVVAVSVTGDRLRSSVAVGDGCLPFGLPLQVTKCVGNQLFELDGVRAHDLFQLYTPGAVTDSEFFIKAVLYPLIVSLPDNRRSVVTVVGRDTLSGSLTFYGEMVEGSVLYMARFSSDSMLKGIDTALARIERAPNQRGLMLTASCMARRLTATPTLIRSEALKFAEFETNSAGFYSYGEYGRDSQGNWARGTQSTSSLFITEA